MFMLTSKHKARMAAQAAVEAAHRNAMYESLGNRIDQARNDAEQAFRAAARANGEVNKLCNDLEVSHGCSSAQAAIIRDNNRLLAEHKATITDLTNALNTRTDQLNLARAQRGCATEERIFQQLGALLAEKPASKGRADLEADNTVLRERIKRAIIGLGYRCDPDDAIAVLRGVK